MTSDSRFLVIGESVVDLVRAGGTVTSTPGGSPANVAVALGRLGSDVEFVTELGRDAGGDLIRRHLEGSRVSISAQPVEQTPSAMTRIRESGAAGYEFDLGWTLRPPLAPPAHGTVHVGSLGAVLAPGAATVRDLLDRLPATVVVSYDPNCRPSLMGEVTAARAAVEALVARAHLVKVSDDDLGWLYPGEPVDAVAQRWLATGPALVVVTLGAAGSTAVSARRVIAGPAVRVAVVDTIGAGDTFMAGLLHRLSQRGVLTPAGLRDLTADDLTDVLSFAAAFAAVTCARVGADPPWRAELLALDLGPRSAASTQR